MIEIIPAILKRDKRSVVSDIVILDRNFKKIQIDICDGKYVDSKTFLYNLNDKDFRLLLEEATLNKKSLSLDLMIEMKTIKQCDKLISLLRDNNSKSLKEIIIHFNSLGNQEMLDMLIQNINKNINIILAIEINNDNKIIKKWMMEYYNNRKIIKGLQIMGVEHIGRQGETISNKVYSKIKYFRGVFPNMSIQIDGGANLKNIERLRMSGANAIVFGSQIYNGDVGNNIKNIKEYLRLFL